jgi:nucleoside phosphorylase
MVLRVFNAMPIRRSNFIVLLELSLERHLPIPSGRKGRAIIGLMTVTVEEAEVVNRVFGLTDRLVGTAYMVSQRSEPNGPFLIVHRRTPHQTNVTSLQTAGDIIEDFRPEYLVLIGTAGGHSGRDNIGLGDVVIANYLDYSGYWKYSDGVALERKLPHDHPSGHLLENYVEGLRMNPAPWIERIDAVRPEEGSPKLFVGGIVSGNTLLGDPGNQEQKRILEHFDKAYAFEMEGYGLSSAVYKARADVHYNPQYLIVRGISDFVDREAEENNATRQRWTSYAVSAAASCASLLINEFLAVNGHTPDNIQPAEAPNEPN